MKIKLLSLILLIILLSFSSLVIGMRAIDYDFTVLNNGQVINDSIIIKQDNISVLCNYVYYVQNKSYNYPCSVRDINLEDSFDIYLLEKLDFEYVNVAYDCSTYHRLSTYDDNYSLERRIKLEGSCQALDTLISTAKTQYTVANMQFEELSQEEKKDVRIIDFNTTVDIGTKEAKTVQIGNKYPSIWTIILNLLGMIFIAFILEWILPFFICLLTFLTIERNKKKSSHKWAIILGSWIASLFIGTILQFAINLLLFSSWSVYPIITLHIPLLILPHILAVVFTYFAYKIFVK